MSDTAELEALPSNPSDPYERAAQTFPRLSREQVERARAFISEKMGRSWVRSAVTGRLAIAAGQIRQKLGMPPNHPSVSAAAPQ